MRIRRASLPLVLVVAACLLGAAATPALAANEIAYRCDLDICLLDPANPGAVTNLTDNGNASYDEKPIWSPDGTKVAFVSDFTKTGHGEKNVFVMDTTASGQAVNLATQITPYSSGAKAISDLAWSPDGSRIAYTRGNNAGDDKVFVVNADGTTTFPLEIGGGGAKRHPSWSPDSSRIAYAVVKNEPEQIYLAPSSGGFGQPLANGVGHEPNWSPDGSRIAFDGYRPLSSSYVDLHVVSADGSGTPLIVTPSSYTQWTFSAWSPDGGRIAYRTTNSEGKSTYRVMNADGSGDHPVATAGDGDDRGVSWSPDGSRLVFEHAPFPNTGAADLYVANADGSGPAVPLTTNGKGYEPAWRVVRNTPQLPPPHPGVEKPKVVWITKRIPWTGGRPTYVASVFCGAPSCGVGTTGKMKAARAAGLPFRPAALALAKPKGKGKKHPKEVVVGRGKITIPGGQTARVPLRLNKLGAAVMRKRGKATIRVTVTIRPEGGATVRQTHTVRLYLKKAKKQGR